MSALARYFKNLGRGFWYDKTPSVLTNELIESGISIHFEDDIDLLFKRFYLNTLVIITPVPRHIQSGIIFRKRLSSKKKS
jgi:UDP-N-acetylmuramate--alanine ligase